MNIRGVVTTFLTGTITSIGMSTINGIKKGFRGKTKKDISELPVPRNLYQRFELQLIVFFAYGATAVITGWLEYHGSHLLPLLPLLLIIIVLIIVLSRPEHPHLLNNLQETESNNQKINPGKQ